jgi:hypothetical protein
MLVRVGHGKLSLLICRRTRKDNSDCRLPVYSLVGDYQCSGGMYRFHHLLLRQTSSSSTCLIKLWSVLVTRFVTFPTIFLG